MVSLINTPCGQRCQLASATVILALQMSMGSDASAVPHAYSIYARKCLGLIGIPPCHSPEVIMPDSSVLAYRITVEAVLVVIVLGSAYSIYRRRRQRRLESATRFGGQFPLLPRES